jgi:hypothetical protein
MSLRNPTLLVRRVWRWSHGETGRPSTGAAMALPLVSVRQFDAIGTWADFVGHHQAGILLAQHVTSLVQAAKLLGITQARVSDIKRGKFG